MNDRIRPWCRFEGQVVLLTWPGRYYPQKPKDFSLCGYQWHVCNQNEKKWMSHCVEKEEYQRLVKSSILWKWFDRTNEEAEFWTMESVHEENQWRKLKARPCSYKRWNVCIIWTVLQRGKVRSLHKTPHYTAVDELHHAFSLVDNDQSSERTTPTNSKTPSCVLTLCWWYPLRSAFRRYYIWARPVTLELQHVRISVKRPTMNCWPPLSRCSMTLSTNMFQSM